MKKLLILLTVVFTGNILHAQYVYTIKADSVKITNSCDTAELILENHTQNVLGFLYNKGKGRTEFRKAVKLNDSTLVFGDDTLVIRGGTTASNGNSLTGAAVQWGQNVGDAGNPATLVNNREIPMNGKNVFFTGDSGTVTIGSNTNSGFRLQTPTLQVGDFFVNRAYLTSYHLEDSVTSSNWSTLNEGEIYAKREVNYLEDGLVLPSPGKFQDFAIGTINSHRAGSSVTLSQGSTYTGTAGAWFGLFLRKRPGFSGTTTFTGPINALGAAPAIHARVDISQSGLTPSNNLLATGWYCGIKPVITTSPNNTVDNFIWFNAGVGQFLHSGCVTNGYELYLSPINSYVTNKWAIYQEGTADTNFFAGKTKMPNLVSQTDTGSYKPVTVDANGNISKLNRWPATASAALAIHAAGTSDFTASVETLEKLPDLAGAGSHSVTLPSAASNAGRKIYLWNMNSSGNSWTFAAAITLPDGTTSTAIANQITIELVSDGSNWIKWK